MNSKIEFKLNGCVLELVTWHFFINRGEGSIANHLELKLPFKVEW